MISNLRGADSLQHFLKQNLDPGIVILSNANNLQNLSQQSSRFRDPTLLPVPNFLQQAPDFLQQQALNFLQQQALNFSEQQASNFAQLGPDLNIVILRDRNSLQYQVNDRTPKVAPTLNPQHSRKGAHIQDQYTIPLLAIT